MDGKKINLKQNQKKKKNSKSLSYFITIGLFLLLGVLIVFYFHYYFFGGRITNYIKNNEMISVLLLGLDELENQERTDTIILGLYNPQSKRFGVLSIPRDLKVEVENNMGTQTEKINAIYSKYGIKKLFKIIREITGINTKFYAKIKLNSIIKIVDLMGGVEIYIDKPMKYKDNAAELNIELPKGIINLDGLKAMQFIRFRSDERGDIGRIERQYEFILNMIKKAIVKNKVLNNIKMLKILYKNLSTNLNFSDIINLIKYTSSSDFNIIETAKIPGRFVNQYGIEYIEPEMDKTKTIMNNLFNKMSYSKVNYVPQEIKVQVLNGSGQGGVAKRIRDKLVRNGFNVIEFGNAPTQNYEHTLILNRTGNMRKAIKVASILKCKNVYPQINKFIMLDVTVIVGRDYQKHF
jgi:LCP family protein required for cell wall assembly